LAAPPIWYFRLFERSQEVIHSLQVTEDALTTDKLQLQLDKNDLQRANESLTARIKVLEDNNALLRAERDRPEALSPSGDFALPNAGRDLFGFSLGAFTLSVAGLAACAGAVLTALILRLRDVGWRSGPMPGGSILERLRLWRNVSLQEGPRLWRSFSKPARRGLQRSFEHYLDPRIIKAMLDAGTLPSSGGERREITALFTDIAGFTALSETMPAEQVAALLGDYFDGVCAAVLESGGLVSVFLGDGLLAIFGAPQRQDDHPDRAVEAALRIDAFARDFADEQRTSKVAFGETCIGVHTGVALVGNIGTRARLNYGAIGDVVNTASRLEALNKRIGTRIAVSGETAARCVRHRFRPVGEFVLHGRRAALPVATPLTPSEAADRERVERYEAAYAALRAGDAGAGEQFLALRLADPGDPCVAFHCARLATGRTGTRLFMEDVDAEAGSLRSAG
jgi:class 3 adenylate cyclase